MSFAANPVIDKDSTSENVESAKEIWFGPGYEHEAKNQGIAPFIERTSCAELIGTRVRWRMTRLTRNNADEGIDSERREMLSLFGAFSALFNLSWDRQLQAPWDYTLLHLPSVQFHVALVADLYPQLIESELAVGEAEFVDELEGVGVVGSVLAPVLLAPEDGNGMVVPALVLATFKLFELEVVVELFKLLEPGSAIVRLCTVEDIRSLLVKC
ncbi:hypothetical protein CPB84DRAFT_1747131 [Gymnopilus junonius]|uniref:Uncharacterized protein n=1 Tax=Gymnopilus junonius TaxID=109634 RepID=A0A9P5TP90_GYMJU|nr:hypothetical protein CPB84DRAFT_1747131 [Gymnopilus junonius]